MKIVPLILCLAAVFAAAAQQDPKRSGPAALVIMYRCAPAQRVELHRRMAETGLRRFEDWKGQGILASYHILFSRYVNTNTWDMMALLRFSDYSGATRWKEVERSMPAGLAADTLALTTAVNTYPADLMLESQSEGSQGQPVYLVVPYTYSVSTPAYLSYADNYIKPQFDGWLVEGILASYELFLQRYSGVWPWDSLIVLKYKDEESLGARERIKEKVRERLQGNPTWKAISENKQSIRTEKEAVIADELLIAR